jgi:hypothetical protein
MCKKSAVNMELQWQKLTQAIESQPMPEQFESTRAVIKCNDCSAKSAVKYHWLGNKCGTCDSYNTNELRIVNGPESEELAQAIVDADSGARSPASASSPSSVPLRSPRYYFQPDQPEERWLPSQLPSFNFQRPQFGMPQFAAGMPQFLPGMAQLRGMPQLPGMRNLPGMPQLPFPQMPQMLDPTELMERVSRSFSQYLNPTGEVAEENVPIIDLGDEGTECQATDGSTVRQPSLPQYVLERFTKSFTPLRNYLNSLDNIPTLDLDGTDQDPDGISFWGEDGQRVDSLLSGGESGEEDDEEDGSSSEESADDEDEDEEDEGSEAGGGKGKEFDLPWKP